MRASYFFAFSWGILIPVSLTGWGCVLNRLLFPKAQTDWGQRAAWGLALSVVVGGVLNLLSCISRTTILVYLGLGMVAWATDCLLRRSSPSKSASQLVADAHKNRKAELICAALVVLLVLIQY